MKIDPETEISKIIDDRGNSLLFRFLRLHGPPLYYMIMGVSGKDVIYVEKSKNTFCAEPDRLHAHR